MRVDTHHHLWLYTPDEYGWIDDRMGLLRRNFLPADFAAEARAAGVQAAIAVQARQSVKETAWLLELARQNPLIQGVIGWAPIASDEFPDVVPSLADDALLKGLRHVVQGEPDGFLDDTAFNRGISALHQTGLVYELLIYARQLREAARFVDRHPNQPFVLNHIAKPDIAHDGFAPWHAAICELARRDNVVCKVSGMVTEADWTTWSPQQLQPYFETVLDAFTPARLMIGSDWPVLNLACTYSQWWDTLAAWLTPLTATDRQQIEGGTAVRTYNLTPRPVTKDHP